MKIFGCFGLNPWACFVCLCWSAAIAQLPSVPTRQSDSSPASLAEARKLVAADEFGPAATLLTEFVKTDKDSAEAHRLLAYSYLRLNDPKHSLVEYTSAAAIERPSPTDLWNVAKDYVLLDDMTSAQHWVRVGLEINPKDTEGWYLLGRISYSQQHFQDAVDSFHRALTFLPQSVKAENNLGLAYEALNRGDDAVAAYRQAIEWQRNDSHPSEQPLVNLGIMLSHQGKLDEAFSLLNQAVSIAPKDPRVREEFGHLCLQTAKLDLAQQQLQEAVRLDPTKASAHFFLGKTYHLQGQDSKAKTEFARAASLSGGKPKVELF